MNLSSAFKSLTVLTALTVSMLATPARAADLVMWERSGGNKDMVDKLVEMWNEKYPERQISLTYIPHAEMVAETRASDSLRRRARSNGHGPHLRPTIREGGAARRHH